MVTANQTASMTGLDAYGAYAGSATAGAAIDKLTALLDKDATSTLRGYLDEMSPAARAQLLVELAAMKTVVNLFEAP